MQADLRAPDPTLTSLAPGHIVEVIPSDVFGEPSEAHHVGSRHAAGPMARACDARWFAVPCRACFPEAPEPGTQGDGTFCGRDDCIPAHYMDPYLAWQVASDG